MAHDREQSWEIYDAALPFAGLVYSKQRVRMAVIGLGKGDLLAVTPGHPVSDAAFEQLARWGTPKFLLAPNHFHNAGLAPWKARFPEARVIAHPRAIPRLQKKVPGLTFEPLSVLEAALPPGVRVFGPPQAKQGEVTVSVKTSEGTAWFVCDNIMNLETLPPFPMRLVLQIVGFRAKLMTNPFFKRMFLTDKAAYKAWVNAELDKDPPALLVPSHGGVLRGPDLVSRLRAITDAA